MNIGSFESGPDGLVIRSRFVTITIPTEEVPFALAGMARAMRASPDRAETVKLGSVSEANSTRSGEAGGAQDLTRIGDGQ